MIFEPSKSDNECLKVGSLMVIRSQGEDLRRALVPRQPRAATCHDRCRVLRCFELKEFKNMVYH